MYTRTKKTLTYSVLERPVCIRRPAASTDVNASDNVTMVFFIVSFVFVFFFVDCFFVLGTYFFCPHFFFLLPPFWNKYLSITVGIYIFAKRGSKRPEICIFCIFAVQLFSFVFCSSFLE